MELLVCDGLDEGLKGWPPDFRFQSAGAMLPDDSAHDRINGGQVPENFRSHKPSRLTRPGFAGG
jgi:hypothetical protein